MKSTLLWKLLAINAAMIGVVFLVVWLAVDFLAADYFSVLMERYNISPADSHQMFLDAIHRYLIQVSVAALALAVLLSFLLTRKVLRPLSDMAAISRRIAAGDYTDRVEAASRDEVGHLARAFNQMADSLERVERLRRSMVVDMAHELRTPLTNIRGYLEALADGVVPPSKETFEMLQEEILRLVRLAEDLNQLTKADAARAYLQREEISLPDLIDQVLELYRYQFESRGISVETDYAEGSERTTGDRDKLLQVLRNLIQNACQYASSDGAFTVAAERARQGIKVTFANTGPGIDEADLKLIFERFHRAEKSRSRDSGGAGIGLAIVKELVEAHGGQVGAESAEGQIRIWFTLPG
jgi:signal transduction histidine kinase